jgi:large subunit ribosomal protein L24
MSARIRITKLVNQAFRSNRKPKEHDATPQKHWNIVRGDKIQIIGDHSERGKQGVVSQVLRDQKRVIVEGINLYNKHVKGQPDRGIPGRTITRERSLPYANVNLLDPVSGQPTRIYRKVLEDGTKVRVSKKSGAIIPRPELLAYRKRPLNHIVTESDTSEADAWEVSYVSAGNVV